MTASRSTVLGWIGELAAALVTDTIDREAIDDRIAAAPALDGPSFCEEALQLVRIVAENASAPADFSLFTAPADLDEETAQSFAILVVTGLSISGPRIDWPSRPAARDARSAIATATEAALSVASGLGADGAGLYAFVSDVSAVAIRIVSDIAANAVPMVRVETGISLPSSVVAHALYGDASRAGAVAEIAGSMTPMLMPSAFEALES